MAKGERKNSSKSNQKANSNDINEVISKLKELGISEDKISDVISSSTSKNMKKNVSNTDPILYENALVVLSKRYLRKELLWPYLDDLANKLIDYLNKAPSLPDWIHAHYADAGYVGSLVSRRLGIPLVFTGHSLGREKQRRLLAGGVDHDQIEQTYSISRRIEACLLYTSDAADE